MKRFVSGAVCVLAILVFGGCVCFYSSKKMVGENQERIDVKFENDAAATLFYASLKKQCPTMLESTRIGVPFVTFYRSSKVLSDTAMFNKGVEICDLDGNGIITEHEATLFHSRVTNTHENLMKVMDKANISISQ